MYEVKEYTTFVLKIFSFKWKSLKQKYFKYESGPDGQKFRVFVHYCFWHDTEWFKNFKDVHNTICFPVTCYKVRIFTRLCSHQEQSHRFPWFWLLTARSRSSWWPPSRRGPPPLPPLSSWAHRETETHLSSLAPRNWSLLESAFLSRTTSFESYNTYHNEHALNW